MYFSVVYRNKKWRSAGDTHKNGYNSVTHFFHLKSMVVYHNDFFMIAALLLNHFYDFDFTFQTTFESFDRNSLLW